MSAPNDPFFRPIGEQAQDGVDDNAANPAAGGGSTEPRTVEEIESLCMECQQNGMTRLLLTYIPYFREVIVVSFYCEHCGNRNNEIQSAGQIQEKGCIYTVHVTTTEDLNRQVVKSEWCTLSIPELALEIPPKKGQLTTIEGVVSDTLRDLEIDQPVRKHVDPPTYEKIEALCDKLRLILGEEKGDDTEVTMQVEPSEDTSTAAHGLKSHGAIGNGSSSSRKADREFPPFSLRVDDPSGNSFVEFLGDVDGRGVSDVKWSKRDYARTKAQNDTLGLSGPADGSSVEPSMGHGPHVEGFSKKDGETEHDNEEIYSFEGTCSSCNSPLHTLMKQVNIPYFKDIIIMSTNCERCGYRDNEVKAGGAIAPEGRKLTLKVEDSEDLSRDVLKSETAGFEIPEIDLHLSPGTLGGRFTTLEGLLQQVYDELSQRVLMRGDSSQRAATFEGFLGKLKSVISAKACPYTVILDDPLANSYIQNPYAPDPDEQLTVETYTRTYEQNEDLGLNDINVEDYSDDSTRWQQEIESRRRKARGELESLQEAPEEEHTEKRKASVGGGGTAPVEAESDAAME